MAEHAAHWVDHVIPHVPTRQWVLTVPWGRRWLLARNPALLKGVHRIAMRIVERWYARQANATQEGKAGSVTVVQRFGSDIRLNLHFHSIFLDGVYCKKANGALKFRPVVPHTEDVERLVVSIAESCEKWLMKQGYGAEDEAIEEDDAQAVIQAAALAGQAALGGWKAGTKDSGVGRPRNDASAKMCILRGLQSPCRGRDSGGKSTGFGAMMQVYPTSTVSEVEAGAASGRKPRDDAEAKMERWNDRNRIFTYGVCGAPCGDNSPTQGASDSLPRRACRKFGIAKGGCAAPSNRASRGGHGAPVETADPAAADPLGDRAALLV
jgi:hypothetical protein